MPAVIATGAVTLKDDRPRPGIEPLPAAKIIDLHCHTAGIGAGGSGCFVSDKMRRNFRFHAFLGGFGVSRAELEEKGDAVVMERIAAQVGASSRVSHAVVLALDGAVDARGELDRSRTEMYVPNEFVAAQVKKHPQLLFGASVNPYRRDALARLESAKAEGAVLVKWLPSVQHIDPSDPQLVPFYRKMVELKLPLLTHTGVEHAFTKAENKLCDPERLRLPLQEGVVVIAAHAATKGSFEGEPAIDRLARLMRVYPDLYADTSSLTQINKRTHLAKVLRRPEFEGRLLYGTDYPLPAMRVMVSPWYFPLRLSWRQKREISRIQNPWDRDVALKHALGMPAYVWTNSGKVLAPR